MTTRGMRKTFEIAPWAVPMYRSTARIIVVHGGRGGGKDTAVIDMALTRMLAEPNYNVVCLRQFQTTMQDSLKRLAEGRIRNLVENYDQAGKFKVNRSEIVCTEKGGVMSFRGFDRNVESLRGLEDYNLAIVNESQILTEEADDIMRPSIRAPGSQIVYIGNPRYVNDYFTRRLIQDPPPEAEIYNVNWRHNPWFPEVLEGDRRSAMGTHRYWHVWEGHTITQQGAFFNASKMLEADGWPDGAKARAWDLAATAGAGDWTVGVLMARKGDEYQVLDIIRGQWDAGDVERRVLDAARADGRSTLVVIEQEPGAAGKRDIRHWQNRLSGYRMSKSPVSGSKATRAQAFAGSVNNGHVSVKEGAPWRWDLFAELASFSEDKTLMRGKHDDQVDACAMAFNHLSLIVEETVTAHAGSPGSPGEIAPRRFVKWVDGKGLVEFGEGDNPDDDGWDGYTVTAYSGGDPMGW